MKSKKWKVYIPAIIVFIICASLIAYQFHAGSTGGHGLQGHSPNGKFPKDGKHFVNNPLREIFNWFGTGAIIGGAITYSWVRFKKKLKSDSPMLKKFSKLIFRAHHIIGYAMLILGLGHGIYYLLTEKITNKGMLSGIAAFVLLLTVGVYGFLIKRQRNKQYQKVHFWISNASLLALLVHAGSSFIGIAVGTVAVWGAVEMAERTVLKKHIVKEKLNESLISGR